MMARDTIGEDTEATPWAEQSAATISEHNPAQRNLVSICCTSPISTPLAPSAHHQRVPQPSTSMRVDSDTTASDTPHPISRASGKDLHTQQQLSVSCSHVNWPAILGQSMPQVRPGRFRAGERILVRCVIGPG